MRVRSRWNLSRKVTGSSPEGLSLSASWGLTDGSAESNLAEDVLGSQLVP